MANQNYESEDDFARMQQEAIRRVRDMQNRARATLEKAGMHIENSNADYPSEQEPIRSAQPDPSSQPFSTSHSYDAPHTTAARADDPRSYDRPRNSDMQNNAARDDEPRANEPHQNQRPLEKHVPQLKEPPLMQALGLNIALDSDQLLLLSTIYLLIKDGADKWLILALAYVMFT